MDGTDAATPTIRRFHLRRAPHVRGDGRQLKIYPGDASGEAPPVPIPNTEVKLSSAEDTRGATSWENRSSPGYFISIVSAPTVFGGGARCYARASGSRLSAARPRRRTRRRRSTASTPRTDASPRTRRPRSTASTQAQLCLTDAHARCERYLAYASRTGARDPRSRFRRRRLRLAPACSSRRSRPGAAWPGAPGPRARRRGSRSARASRRSGSPAPPSPGRSLGEPEPAASRRPRPRR